ncbi:MAG: hypothetical protein FK734_06380 [Asgard group archaeon]|nr:hypothetical protein [Asgard group archaeon]
MANLRNDDLDDDEESLSSLGPRQSRIKIGERVDTIDEINPKKALKNLHGSIKDYEDYQTVPNRRKTDAIFRDYFSNHINQTNDILKEVHAMLIEKQQMSSWSKGVQLTNEISSFSKDIDRGDYGFTTFFENPKLLEIDISQLYLIDHEIYEALLIIRERTEAFMHMVQLNYLEDIEDWFTTLDRILGKLIRLNDDRLKLIGSYERISY